MSDGVTRERASYTSAAAALLRADQRARQAVHDETKVMVVSSQFLRLKKCFIDSGVVC